MLDLDCKRDQAVSEYKEALETRDGQQDTRLAAERGVKTAYAVKGHSCDEDADDDTPDAAPSKPGPRNSGARRGQEAMTGRTPVNIFQPEGAAGGRPP